MNIAHDPETWVCPECGDRTKKYFAKNLCATCYARQFRRKRGMKERPFWKKYTKCRVCGKEEIKALGMCAACYNRYLENKNYSRRKQQKKKANQKYGFGRSRTDIYKTLGNRCAICGISEADYKKLTGRSLEIHHKDGNGRTSESPNHDISNLVVLCKRCHRNVHLGKEAV